MPYIKIKDRTKFNDAAKSIADNAECAGDLNYALTYIIHSYLLKKGIKYANLNEVVGMLECCKLELYRKVIGPYENIKIDEAGDVGLISDNELGGKAY